MNSIIEWIAYFFRSKHRRGFGVHSPFVFYLVTKVIEEKYPYYKYELIEKVRKLLFETKKQIQVKDGRGELVVRNISGMAKKSSKMPSYDQILFRLVNHSKSKFLLELKASFGLSSMYMAAPDSKSQLWTIEEGDMAKYAKLSFQNANFPNIHLEEGVAEECLDRVLHKMERIDFLFFNPDPHSAEVRSLVDMYAKCSQKLNEKSVVVVDGIHRTPSMKRFWEQLKTDEKIRVTIDVFSFGIVYYSPELQKEDYVLRFFPSIKRVGL